MVENTDKKMTMRTSLLAGVSGEEAVAGKCWQPAVLDRRSDLQLADWAELAVRYQLQRRRAVVPERSTPVMCFMTEKSMAAEQASRKLSIWRFRGLGTKK